MVYYHLSDRRVLSFDIRNRFAVQRTINLLIEKHILRYFATTMCISQMTGNKVPGLYFPEIGNFYFASICHQRAAWMKNTTCWRISWTWWLPFQDDSLPLAFQFWIRNGHR